MNRTGKYSPSAEDIIELCGIEILHPGGKALTNRTAELCNLKPGMKILDVSSGRGTQSVFYAEQFGVHVTGLDLSLEMIQSANELAQKSIAKDRITFKQGDSQNLPFADNSFDAVINECAVGIPDDSQKVLNEMTRVTKSGGRAAIHESTFRKSFTSNEKMEIVERYGTTPYELDEWLNMIKIAGISDVQYELEQWSEPKHFYQIRENREIKKPNEIITLSEKIYISRMILKKYGIKGLINSYNNEKFIWNLIHSGNLGYCLYVGNVVKN